MKPRAVDDGKLLVSQPQIAWADADYALQSATVFGITANPFSISQQVAFGCPSSDCKFEPVLSLAVCSQCSDVTSKLEKNTNSDGSLWVSLDRSVSGAQASFGCTEYRLPNDLYLNNVDDSSGGDGQLVYMTTFGTTNRSRTVTMGDVDTLIWSQSMIKVDAKPHNTKKWPDYNMIASECALYYCVKKYSAEIRNGTISEETSVIEDARRAADSWQIQEPRLKSLNKNDADSIAYDIAGSGVKRSDLRLESDGSGLGWNISQDAINGVSSFVQKTFQVCMNENCTKSIADVDPINGYYIASSAVQYDSSVAKVFFETTDFNGIFTNIAASMSTAIRNGDDDSTGQSGLVGTPTTVYAVDWRWIILHCVTEFGAVIFLISTIWITWRHKQPAVPAWKASELAVMSRGVGLGDKLKDVTTKNELEERARALSVVLIGDHDEVASRHEREMNVMERNDHHYNYNHNYQQIEPSQPLHSGIDGYSPATPSYR